MKALRNRVERFCYKHPHFGVPNLMRLIVIITALVYVISRMDTTNLFVSFLTFSPALILRGQIWRLITWIFLPIHGNILYTAIALYFYYFIGSTLEKYWGNGKFTIYYLISMLLTIIYAFILFFITRLQVSITASYINLSMFFAFASIFPEERVLVLFIIPVKMKWLALIDAAFFIVSIIRYIAAGYWYLALMPIIAMLAFILYCGSDLTYILKRSKVGNVQSKILNFKTEARKINRNQHSETSSTNFRHKCSVCGKTDTDYPEMEFRYCSRCQGYHCFCMDHINNHVHFEN